jgi:serine/threonine protein kinase
MTGASAKLGCRAKWLPNPKRWTAIVLSKADLNAHEFEVLQELFDQAIALPQPERITFLHSVNAEYPRLIQPLQHMLRHDAFTELSATQMFSAPAQNDSEVTRCIAGYEQLKEIGRGGMGVVYTAHQLSPTRVVALKMIRFAQLASKLDLQRFNSEIDAIAKLSHPYIVPIYEIGSYRGEPFFTMPFIEGIDFGEYLTSSEFSRKKAMEIFIQVCEAVAYCHDRGIIHRDLKPSNILLDKDRVPKLADFGLAKHLEKNSQLTQTGDLMGTPGYVAPEQFDISSRVSTDARSDVYSLGAILYRILTGKLPIDLADLNLANAIVRIRSNDVMSPRLVVRGIARDLETICMKCLDARPENRYANAGEVAEELRRFADGEPISAMPLSGTRRLLRWSRQQPGLAVSWLVLSTFYVYHLLCYWFDVTGTRGQFHWIATGAVVVWAVGSYVFQKLLVRTSGASWPLFSWVTMEVALLTVVIASGSPNTSLVSLYVVLVTASVLRFRTVLVGYMTILCLLAYVFHVWRTVAADVASNITIDLTRWIPLGLAILSTGIIQYFALRRSQNAVELLASRRQ